MKNVLVLFICIACTLGAAAQKGETMMVLRNNGSTPAIAVSDIDKVAVTTLSATTVGEAVDLGLSVKWASHNIGAPSPEYYGFFFTWGETETKDTFTDANSLTYTKNKAALLEEGIIDENGHLTPEHDAATANWGEGWRMPTSEECTELVDNCTWTMDVNNGIKGYTVTGPNGNSIFLPFCGLQADAIVNTPGMQGYYWSSSISEGYSNYTDVLFIHPIRKECAQYDRIYGYSIRPVYDVK